MTRLQIAILAGAVWYIVPAYLWLDLAWLSQVAATFMGRYLLLLWTLVVILVVIGVGWNWPARKP